LEALILQHVAAGLQDLWGKELMARYVAQLGIAIGYELLATYIYIYMLVPLIIDEYGTSNPF
jgi:hypothetical protein